MKNRMKYSAAVLLLFFAACAVPTVKESVPEKPPFSEVVATLPQAVVSADGLNISYPDERLFASGAILPLAGGMEVLDPLITLLQRYPERGYVAVVRSSGHADDYDRLLAGKRLELLERIFRNRGIKASRLVLKIAEGPGAPLELQFQPESPASSSGEKE